LLDERKILHPRDFRVIIINNENEKKKSRPFTSLSAGADHAKSDDHEDDADQPASCHDDQTLLAGKILQGQEIIGIRPDREFIDPERWTRAAFVILSKCDEITQRSQELRIPMAALATRAISGSCIAKLAA
jgi:hypothetical protein